MKNVKRVYYFTQEEVAAMRDLIHSGLSALYVLWVYMSEYAALHFKGAHDGLLGDVWEAAIRYHFNRQLQTVIKPGAYDIRSKRYGRLEVKQACTEIPTGDFDSIIYCPVVDVNRPAEGQAYIFTREEWEEMLEGYDGRGELLRWDSNRSKANIQSFYGSETIRPKASKPIRRYLDRCCESQPTLEEE
jgi:hypothetical protein